ncbi:xanthine dehydrogenase family protein molybdopterin-binding subunit [Natronocalculus amylovorans]|uniref:Xanthine dehydrogenase family protein molybdopterin-binding subunit n=1 Tax=Natronocalculus amylovorans TaxID=2917812 RepID=A0AAE3FYA1_9EURY|nr:xanthine dehydrogenase family protein molybdopterin-binding subunit [Natronocalculus amylovorans]MCL9817431.1 xanthine dehydrogenase family protein molybdopterin-binding subunit [Natronocalculus amylovorans]
MSDAEDRSDKRVFGKAIKRNEDIPLLTGSATYTDDVMLREMVHLAIRRSDHAHATIVDIDTSEAEAMDGVIAVYTGEDVVESGVPNTIPTAWMLPGLVTPQYRMLAVDKVRHEGDGIAAVVAETPEKARDALDAIEVTYEKLEHVTDPVDAVESDVPPVHDEAADNVAFDFELGEKDVVDEAFEAADHVVSVDLRQPRIIPNAMEPRAAVADWDRGTEELRIWMTSQNPHLHRMLLSAGTLGVPENKIQVIAPEVGGGFGSKIYHYPDEAVTAWCSMQLGRPVKWKASRMEAYVTDCHGRDHTTTAEIAVNDDGTVQGVRVETYAGLGAQLSQFATATPSYLYSTILSGEYAIPAIYCRVIGAFTNTTPVDAYRGAGRAEGIYVIERLMDVAARELDMDPAEFRRRNLIPADQFPYQTAAAVIYDSGEYERAMDTALEHIGYDDLRERQKALREEGRYLGIGVGNFVESAGLSPSGLAGDLGAQAGGWESSIVRFDSTGTVTVLVGTADQGQGHRTTFAQIAAEELGVDIDAVNVVEGDTDQIPQGMGTYGSRSASVGGGAIARGARDVREKAREIAAHQLEASVEDIGFDDGEFHVVGAPDRSMHIQAVAAQAYLGHNLPEEMDPGLESTNFYDPENFTFPFGTHVAVVEIDPETGAIDLERYVAVDDCGEIINPLIVEGQVHGGIAQGIGAALYEGAVYDDDGHLTTRRMDEYAVPHATYLPDFETENTVTPSPHNPIGVKGVGESATIAAAPTIVSAVVDALEPFGVTHLDMPITPERVWRAMGGGD